MKYMLIMRSTDEAIEASKDMDFDEIIAAMGQYNESLIKAGVLLAGEGLAMEEGFIVDFESDPPLVSDGPYGETKELFSGFWIIQTSTKGEALEWGCMGLPANASLGCLSSFPLTSLREGRFLRPDPFNRASPTCARAAVSSSSSRVVDFPVASTGEATGSESTSTGNTTASQRFSGSQS